MEIKKPIQPILPFPLGTPHISSGSSIVKIIPPHIINPSSYIVTIRVIRQDPEIRQRNQAVVPINHLQIAKIRCFSEAFSGKMATAHLSPCVRTRWPSVHDFPTKLDHVCVVPQVCEQD